MERFIYSGKIRLRGYEGNDEAVFIGNLDEPIALKFKEKFSFQNVTVRYWVSDIERTKSEIKEKALESLVGSVESNYNDRYSEITGYLWTDEDLKIGGHDLLGEISSHEGKFIYLEVDRY